MSRITVRRFVLGLMFVCLAYLGVLGVAQAPADQDLVVVRTISTACALPESMFLVTLHIEVGNDMNGVGIEETLPYGWKIHPVENGGAAFKQAQSQWTFGGKIRAGTKIDICYEVTVPSADKLYSHTLPECFSITGTFQSKVPALQVAVSGDTEIQVLSALPVMSAIAHLIPASDKHPMDTIDLRLTQKITRQQLAQAIKMWRTDTTIPDTRGETIDLTMMERIISYYETCTPVDEQLPSAGNYGLHAVRTITTFLPSDTILLPHGCLDPGIDARRFLVSVEVTAEHDAYGVGLREWFPSGWHVSPLDNDGFAYRPSHEEWIYSGRLAAGDKKTIVYQVEAAPTPPEGTDCPSGCCGTNAKIVGSISSTLGCGEQSVTGEDTVHIWQCLPVILAISRWDAANDSLDVKLSNNISFEQVQRAIAFWEQSAAVPYTCGYTVGYETLKSIVAYWLTGTPVTKPIVGAKAAATPTKASPGSYDWFCQMKDTQESEDRATEASTPVIVVAKVDRQLTCLTSVATLTATISGGRPPYTYTWKDQQGNKVGTSSKITVDKPGTYLVVVNSAGCCAGSDYVTVTQDIVPPTVDAGSDKLLTCAVTSVTLDGSAASGTPPYTYAWTNSSGNVIGKTEDITVDTPDTYTLTVTGTNGCSASDSAVVTKNIEPPTVSAGSDKLLTCAVTSVTLDAKVSGGKPPYTYAWTDSSGNVIGKAEDITVNTPDTYTLSVTGTNGCSASDTTVVTQDVVPPTVDAGADQTITCANPTAKLDATVSGGEPPYTYEWKDSDGAVVGCTEDIIVDQPGLYTLTATGLNGCSGSDRVTVNEDVTPPIVEITSSASTLTCLVEQTTLQAVVSGGCQNYTYDWVNSNGDAIGCTDEITVEKPDTYTVIVTGGNGCLASVSTTIAQDIVPPTVSAGSDKLLTCAVTSVTLDGSAASGTPPYTYAWTNSSGNVIGKTEDITVDTPDTYTLTVTGTNGCSASDSVVVTRNIVPPTVDAGPAQILTCAVPSVTLDGSVSGGMPPYSYVWTDDASGDVIARSEDAAVSDPGTYVFTVTGANGCAASDSVNVTQDISVPIVAIAAPQTLSCIVTSITLDGSASGGTPPYAYAWTDSSGSVIGKTEDIAVDTPDTYTLTVTGSNGCSASDSVTVAQDIEPPTVDAGPDRDLTCLVKEVTLSACVSGGKTPYLYLWRDTAGNVLSMEQMLVVDTAGTYQVTVVGANGCCASDEVAVIDNTAPPVVDAGPDMTITCASPDAHIDANISGGQAPYDILWLNDCGDTVSTTEDITVTLPGVYTIVVTGANGCTASDTVTVADGIVPPDVDAGPDRVLTCENEEVLLDGTVSGGACPYTYKWTNSCGAVVGRTEDITVSLPSVYTLTVTSATGCIGSDSVEVTKEE